MFLDRAQACERIGVSRETLRKLIKSGLLEAHKIGGGRNSPYRISEQAIDDYLRRQSARAMT